MMTVEERDNFMRSAHKRHTQNGGNRKKWTDDEVSVRREAIYHEMGLGKSYSQMVFDLQERWGASNRTIRAWISDAKQELIRQNDENKEEYLNKMIEKLERLAEDALAHNDRKSAIAAYDMVNKLNNAYTQKIEADVKGETTISFRFGNDEQ